MCLCSRLQIRVAVSLAFVVLVENVIIRGVSPADQKKYNGQTFSCDDGRLELSSAAVNDDFCDCLDGSDEPGTGACSGMGVDSTRPWFYCPNSRSVPRYLYPSRVGDGLCDCCDGSDEWQQGACKDNCEDEGKIHRQRLEGMKQSAQKGIAKRREALRERRDAMEFSKDRLPVLRASLPELEANIEARRAKVERLEEVVRNQQGDAIVKADASDHTPDVSEYAKWMEKGNQQEPGVDDGSIGRVLRRWEDCKDVEHVKVWSGALVDRIDFVYRDGTRLRAGDSDGGDEQEPFSLESGEFLSEVRGGQGGLLDSIQFVTSRGRMSKSFGGTGGDRFALRADAAKKIVGLAKEGKLVAIEECASEDLRTAEEKERDGAKDAYNMAYRELSKVKDEIRDLELKITGDFSDPQAAYSLFPDKCGKASFGQYDYEICLYGEAKQGHTTLGRWKGWDARSAHVGLFENGDRCFSGITRTLKANVQCGEIVEIVKVREPSQCTYEATILHPAACDEAAFEANSDLKAIMPNDADHDEL